MPIDRDATLKQAEKLLRQGKLDGAIAEYVRLVEDQPRDWNAINALGDLYVRAGDLDRAVAQFTQVADYLFGEGFFPKAAALYKKALKVKAVHEHTLLRLSEIASQQGLLADARAYLRQLGRQRRDRGDTRGAADCLVRLARLDEADGDAKLAGARAAQALGNTPQAVHLFKDAADELAKSGRGKEALDALAEASALGPGDQDLRRRLARECVAAGQLDRARTFLTRETAGADPDLLLALGRLELLAGNEPEARSVLTRFIMVAPERTAALLQLAGEMARSGQPDVAFACVEVVVDEALLGSAWDKAFAALDAFLAHGAHIPALIKLVELAVDAGRDDVMHDAQARLADGYLAAGRGPEARVIAEDLVARDPASDAHVRRLRQALALLGITDADAIINRYRDAGETAGDWGLGTADWGLGAGDSGLGARDSAIGVDGRQSPVLDPGPPADDAIVIEAIEIDLSDALAGLGAASPMLPPPPIVPTEEPTKAPPDLESVFEEMRLRVSSEQQAQDAAAQYECGLRHLEAGRTAEAFADLQGAARMPLFRFKASARLGRLHVAGGNLQAGIEWLERAAEAPAPSAEESLAVLYDLAGALERIGESARALAILMEIEADVSAYRDVRERIDQLSRAQAGSSRA